MHPLNKYVKDNYQELDAIPKGMTREQAVSLFLRRYFSAYADGKVDGRRGFLFHAGGKNVIATKRNQRYTEADAPILKEIRLPENTTLDVEFKPPSPAGDGEVHAFDILHYNGKDFHELPLRIRRSFLEPLASPALRVLPYYELQTVDEVLGCYQRHVDQGYEGIVLKDPEARYGKLHAWMKLKLFDTFPAFVIEYKATETTKETGKYRCYKMGVMGDGKVVYIGDAGSAECTCNQNPATCPYHHSELIKPGVVLELSYQPTKGFEKLRNLTIRRIREEMETSECTLDQVQIDLPDSSGSR